MDYTLPHFGNINLKDLKEDYYIDAETEKNFMSVELSFENKSIDQEIADGISTFLQNIDEQDQRNRTFIEKDFEEKESEAANYINFYLTEFDEAELLSVVGDNTAKTNIGKQLLNKLELTRIVVYPDGKFGSTFYAMFDYMIGSDELASDQILAVTIDKQGDLDSIGWDS